MNKKGFVFWNDWTTVLVVGQWRFYEAYQFQREINEEKNYLHNEEAMQSHKA